MLLDKQFDSVLKKLDRIEITYDEMIFKKISEVPMVLAQTKEHFRKTPTLPYNEIKAGTDWGGSDITGWFKGSFTPDKTLENTDLYICALTGALENLLFIDDFPSGVYAHKIIEQSRGNHHTLRLKHKDAPNQKIHISIEAYCWHDGVGTQPFADPDLDDKSLPILVYGFVCKMNW